MGHRKWGHYAPIKGQPLLKPTCIDEHNALYQSWEVERDRATDMLDENNRLDRELDEAKKQLEVERDRADDLLKDRNYYSGKLTAARKRIAELESPLRVPFSDEVIERMARGARQAWAGCEGWENMSSAVHQQWRNTIRAALTAGGLEPCPVPQYDPADVALRPADDEVEKLARAIWKSYENLYCRSGVHMIPFEENRVAWFTQSRAAIAHLCPTTGHVLRDRLVDAERKVENQRVELNRLNAMVADLRAQLSALHPGETVEGVIMARDHYRIQLQHESEWVRQYKQDRDDALAELADLRDQIDEDNTNAAAVNDLLVQVQNLTAERDEACARAEKLSAEIGQQQHRIDCYKSELAALRERAAVPAGVRKRPEGREYLAVDDLPTRSEMEREYRLIRDVHSGNYNNALVALHDWIAPRLPEHMRKRPEGLPTAPMLAQSAFAAIRPTDSDWPYQPKPETDRWVAIADHILTYLAPFLRDPVGKPELDVTAEEALCKWLDFVQDNTMINTIREYNDWLRSRIRPTYECKECAEWKAHAAAIEDSSFDMIKRINLARAALEGE